MTKQQASQRPVDEAITFLRRRLRRGKPVAVAEIIAEGEAAGHHRRTLERARGQLGAVTERSGRGFVWRLPKQLGSPAQSSEVGEQSGEQSGEESSSPDATTRTAVLTDDEINEAVAFLNEAMAGRPVKAMALIKEAERRGITEAVEVARGILGIGVKWVSDDLAYWVPAAFDLLAPLAPTIDQSAPVFDDGVGPTPSYEPSPEDLEAACAFLLAELGPGAMPALLVRSRAVKKGLSDELLYAARERLSVTIEWREGHSFWVPPRREHLTDVGPTPTIGTPAQEAPATTAEEPASIETSEPSQQPDVGSSKHFSVREVPAVETERAVSSPPPTRPPPAPSKPRDDGAQALIDAALTIPFPDPRFRAVDRVLGPAWRRWGKSRNDGRLTAGEIWPSELAELRQIVEPRMERNA